MSYDIQGASETVPSGICLTSRASIGEPQVL